jgi:threonine dehydrogenase-like Zn-dependent dehydrogenase
VPGHETVIRIVAVGEKVKEHRIGERCLVQTDYRGLRTTAGSNAAFGYNLEGGLQEYVIVDERISRDAETGERLLLPVGEDRSASAICLVEPWACVEDSYANPERQGIKPGGQLLVIVDAGRSIKGLKESFDPGEPPAGITCVCADERQADRVRTIGTTVETADSLPALKERRFDDIVYFGSDASTIEALNNMLATKGIFNIVTAGNRIGQPVKIGVGRLHYGMTRWIGTESDDASRSYEIVPPSGETRDGDKILIIGAGGPMGQMHAIRNICSGRRDLTIVAADLDDSRLAYLAKKTETLAASNGVGFRTVNRREETLDESFTYIAIMAPIPALVSEALALGAESCIINVFAGIPAPTIHPIDLDTVIARKHFMFGTSGSTLNDMKIVLRNLESGRLDTNLSVDAVSGMAGAIDGIRAVENRTLAGKIIVYPQLHDTPLIPLSELHSTYPGVAAKLSNGQWTKVAEDELLRTAH